MKATFDPGAPATGDGIYGLPHTPDDARVVLVPVPWEPTTSYRRGTAKGPKAILEASKQVDLFDAHFGRAYEPGIAMLGEDRDVARWNEEACALADPVIANGGAGDDAELLAKLARVNDLSKRLDAHVEATAAKWIDRGKIVGLVGGDHSTPFGSIAAHARRYPGLGVLHFDAHADLREAYEGFTSSHASILYNVATRLDRVAKIVQVGVRDFSEEERDRIAASRGRVVTFFDHDIARARFDGEPFAKTVRAIVGELPEIVYVTFDIDGLDPSLCPSTGTPVPGGLSFQEAAFVLKVLAESGKRVVGFDLNEVAPGEDAGEWDGNVGARVLYKLIGCALTSQRTPA